MIICRSKIIKWNVYEYAGSHCHIGEILLENHIFYFVCAIATSSCRQQLIEVCILSVPKLFSENIFSMPSENLSSISIFCFDITAHETVSFLKWPHNSIHILLLEIASKQHLCFVFLIRNEKELMQFAWEWKIEIKFLFIKANLYYFLFTQCKNTLFCYSPFYFTYNSHILIYIYAVHSLHA